MPRRNRADFSSAGPNHDRSITTVVVESIPEEKFSEEAVREFFSAFGSIVDVQMQAYKRLALVKYEDWASAKQAWESPKVIFDNRFVKVYWYKPDSLPRPPGGGVAGGGANGFAREGSQPQVKSAEEVQREMEEITKKQDELQKAHEEKMRKIKETEESRKELEKRRQALLSSQAEETRRLKERLAAKMGASATSPPSASGTPDDKSMSDAPPSSDGTEKKPSSQTEALKAQLAALEAKASSMGIDYALSDESAFSPRGRGRGGYRGRGGRGTYSPSSRGRGGYDPTRGGGGGYRGRGGAPRGGGSAYKLDNRTKKVAVSGVDFDEGKDEGLRQYLLVCWSCSLR